MTTIPLPFVQISQKEASSINFKTKINPKCLWPNMYSKIYQKLSSPGDTLMVVPRLVVLLRQALEFHRISQHHSFAQLRRLPPEQLLPWGMTLRCSVPTAGFECGTSLLDLLGGNQNVDAASVEVDSQFVAVAQERQVASSRGFWTGVEN